MTQEQKLQLQSVVLDHLQAMSKEHPTLLADVLISGDGWNFLNRVLQGEEMLARARAQALNNLLQAIRQQPPPSTFEQPPVWKPPQTTAQPAAPPPYPQHAGPIE